MSQEVIVTCAVTGGHQNHGKHPDYPITPTQIAATCLEARAAGAAIVHIHVRDPETGTPRGDVALYREVVERIQTACQHLQDHCSRRILEVSLRRCIPQDYELRNLL